jgi:hypothetical protein
MDAAQGPFRQVKRNIALDQPRIQPVILKLLHAPAPGEPSSLIHNRGRVDFKDTI